MTFPIIEDRTKVENYTGQKLKVEHEDELLLFIYNSVSYATELLKLAEKEEEEESTNGGRKIFDRVGDEADKKTTFANGRISDQ